MALSRKILKYTAFALANFAGAFVLTTVAGAHYGSSRDKRKPSELADIEGYAIKDINLKTVDDVPISAWYIKNSWDKVVILLSGRHSNREKNIEKAKLYLKRGYSVIMPDLRATGKSGGERISYGWKERKDLLSIYQFLKGEGYKEIGAHGFSLGAATICYTHLHMVNFSFVVLESCYAVLGKAYEGAFKKYNVPSTLLRGIRPMSEYFSGYKEKNMQPKNLIHLIKCPLLVMAGDHEMIVSKKATLTLFRNNRSNLAKLHFFHDAEHENFSVSYKDEYITVLSEFLDLANTRDTEVPLSKSA